MNKVRNLRLDMNKVSIEINGARRVRVRKSKANTPSKNQVQSCLGEKCITHKFEV